MKLQQYLEIKKKQQNETSTLYPNFNKPSLNHFTLAPNLKS